ncbi:AI-2E family transporter [Rhizobium sp. TRM95111]|uniref:AI-2E family transporter n=1 Tax=Rhizobium alarense TaxID=2846851 RepID=UPI001F3F7B03|nr:AI-2E family transporter [Rhizobium alarense]MCF3638588.1 AI-2E family transporter [Rhizobium alarense]
MRHDPERVLKERADVGYEMLGPASPAGTSRKDGLDLAAGWALIGIFLLMALAAVYLMAPILIPLSLAVVTGLILGLAAERLTDAGIPPLPAALLLATAFGVGVFVITGMLVEPLTALANNAPDVIRDTIDRIRPSLERIEWLNIRAETFSTGAMSLESLLENTSSLVAMVSAGVAPALLQALIFFAALVLFLAGRLKLRRMLILAFPRRGQRLAAIRVMNAIDRSLGYYFAIAVVVYAVFGLVTAVIAYAGGFAMPALWGLFAFVASFVPFLGVAVVSAAMAVTGLLTHDTTIAGLSPAIAFLAANLVVENFVFPSVMGRRLQLNAFIIFTAIIFWTWLWGPAGAMLALPLSIIGMTIADELRPVKKKSRPSLPG